MIRRLALLSLALLASCAAPGTETGPAVLGDFRLGYNIVQARDVRQGPFSRDVEVERLTGALKGAIERRLSRYDGDGLYHIGVAIGGYVLAQPGLPVVYTPKSVLIFEVNVYDNQTRKRLNDAPHRIMAFEGIENIAPVVGSGLVRDGQTQLANLVTQGARQLEAWLRENPEWFVAEPGQVRVAADRETLDATADAAVAAFVPAPN